MCTQWNSLISYRELNTELSEIDSNELGFSIHPQWALTMIKS